MPQDPFDYADDDEVQPENAGRTRRFDEFDCPGCEANNPQDERFGDGDEVLCYYCGADFKARVSDEGRLTLREL